MRIEKSRIIVDAQGVFHDEILEVSYEQIYHQTLDQECSAMLEVFLDQYTVPHGGKPFGRSLSNYHVAFGWASQFGTLHVWPIEEDDLVEDYPSIIEHGDKWVAKVGDPSEGARVYARERIEAVILAGVQVLRDRANIILNPAATNATVN